tara:strand:+ start:315 stop:524 length:210 start_codon:yes stop_codon:yes gene_type:complete
VAGQGLIGKTAQREVPSVVVEKVLLVIREAQVLLTAEAERLEFMLQGLQALDQAIPIIMEVRLTHKVAV